MRQHDPMLRLIGAFKLVKAALLVAFAISLLNAAWRDELREWAHAVGVDPEHRFATVLARLHGLDRPHRVEIGIAVLIYASLFALEGVGLVLRRLWAEYLTIVITTSFIPLEIYEMVREGTLLKAIVIALNLLAVVYLLWRLRRDHHWPWHRAS
jgi:uncharacterized membrane protein (DUF2068 family)